MNASSRTARQIIRSRRAENRAAKKPHTLASHARRAGVFDNDASGVAGALRSKGKTCGITGQAVRMFRRNAAGQKLWRQPVKGARRYTMDEFAQLVAAYRPRAEKYALARTQMLSYATR
jgi:hypothetical protein